MGFNSAFKGLKIVKNPGNGRLNNSNDPALNVLKPPHALFCKIHSHSHLKLQTVKNVCETHN